MKRLLTCLGALLLFIGLGMALVSNRHTAKAFDVIAEKNIIADFKSASPRNQEIRKSSGAADVFFGLGLVLTAVGIVFQTVGALLKDPR